MGIQEAESHIRKVSLLQMASLAVFIAILVWAYRGSEGNLTELLSREGRTRFARFLGGMFPPDLSPATLRFLIDPTLQTLQISILGVTFALLIGLPFSLAASRNLVFSLDLGKEVPPGLAARSLYAFSRGLLNLFRAIPDLVWALLFISAVGLGPFPGVLALTVHYSGVLGKVFSEFFESVDPRPLEALQATGANRIQLFWYGIFPQALPQLLSFTLYTWECSIRQATILGFVGAGGIGFYILLATRMLQYDQLLTLIFLVLLLVVLVDRVSALLRRRIV
jgi:phosphonate transport system permease protein